MPQATTNYFDSKRLLDLLEKILPVKVQEEDLNPKDLDQLRGLLALLQSQQSAISQHNKRFSETKRYKLSVTPEQIRLINTLQ